MRKHRVKVSVTRHREFKAFAELANAHWVILENAKLCRGGWLYECLAANILAAFKVEAYVNHIGPLLFTDWKERTPRYKKMKRILEHLGVKDAGDERFQTLNRLFRLRDQIAHGQTKTLHQEGLIETGELEAIRRRKPQESWEEWSTVEFAQQAYDHTEAIIRQVHRAAGLDDADLRRSGHSYSIKRIVEIDRCLKKGK